MTVRTSAGSTIGVSVAAPATFDAAGYTALVFTPVGEVTDLGEFGRVYNSVKFQPLANRGTVKKKGSFDEGSITMALGLDDDDAGQTIIEAGSESDDDHYFCITLQSGVKYFFPAQIMSFKRTVGGVDAITSGSISLEITSSDTGIGVVKKSVP